MTRNIDVGVEIKANSSDLVSGARSAKEAIGGLGDATRKAGADAQNYTSQTDRQASSLASLAGKAGAAAAAYVSFQAAMSGGKAVLDAAIAQERLTNTLQVGMGSAEAASQEISFLRKESEKLGLQFVTTADQYAKLAAAAKGTTLEGQKTRDIFLGVAKAGTVLGFSADQTAGAINALQQMISKGKVSAEELNGQLGERLPGALQMAARAMDMTTAELMDLMQNGKLTAEQLLPKLAAELEKTFGTQAQEAAKGLNAQINRLDNAFEQLKIAIGNLGVVEVLSDGIQLATRFVNALSGVGQQLSMVDAQKQKIQSMRSELESLNNRKAIPLIGDLIFDKKQADLLSQRIDDGINDLKRFEREAFLAAEQGAAFKPGKKPALPDEEVKKQKEARDVADQAAKARAREAQQAVDSSNRIISALKLETDQIGKSAAQKKLLSAAAEAAKAPTKDLAMQIMVSAQAFAEAADREEALKEADKVRLEGLKKLQQQEQQTARAAEEAAQRSAAEWNNLWSGVEMTAKQSFIQFAAHGTSAIQSIGQAIKMSIIDMLYQLTVRKWIINIGATMGASMGMTTANAAANTLNMTNIGSSALNLVKSGFGITGAIGSGLSKLGGLFGSPGLSSFGSGMMGSMGTGMFSNIGGAGTAFIGGPGTALGGSGMGSMASMGSTFAAAAGPLIANLVGFKVGSMIAGDKKIFGMNGNITSLIGTVFGGPVGAVIGGAFNALFGHGPMKFRQQVAIGEASADGFDGRVTDVFRAKGGLFVGNKHKERAAENQDQLVQLFDETIKGFGKSAKDFAANLGLNADAVTGYSKTIRLESEKGKALTEEAIQGMLTGIGEDFAHGLIPEIDSLRKSGESAFDALSRLNTEFTTLVNIGATLGHSLAGTRAFVGSASFTQRSDFIDAAGGLDKLMQNANLFAENFLTVEERLRPAQEKLTEDLGKLGLSADLTREDFKKLALSFGEVGGISQEVFVGLMNSVRDFVEVRAMQDQLKQGVAKEDLSGLRNYFAENFLGLDAQLAPRRAALNEELKKLGLSTDLTREGFIRLVQSFGQVNGVSEEMYVSLLKLAPAYLEVINAQDLLQQQQRQGLLDNLASAYNDLEKSVSKSRTDATNRYNDALKPINERIQTLNNSVGKLKSLSDALKSTLESIRPITRDQAKQQLRDALSGKSPLDIDNLRGALSAVDKISLKDFGSTFDFEEERRRTANLVDALKGKTDKALTTEEKMLRSAEDQKELLDEGFKNEMSRLDSILEQAKNQVNASNNLSTSIKSLADAIAGFNLRAVQAGVPTIGNGSVSGNPNISDQQIRDFIKTPGLTDMDIYNAAKKHGVSFQQYADATGQKVEDLYAWADKNRLKRFAKGGMHSGGLRIVGERGPELEFTGPSRIASNSEFKNLLRSDDLSSDIKELTRQIKKVVSFTKNTSNKLDQVTRNGTAIRTKGVA